MSLLAALALLAAACSDDAGRTVSTFPTDDSTTIGSSTGDNSTSPTSTDDSPVGESDAEDEDDAAIEPLRPWEDVDLSLLTVATLDQPTALAARSGSDDLWIIERDGRVRLVERTLDLDPDSGEGSETLRLRPEPVLDISDRVGTDGEGGLLGLAFTADGERLFLHYTDRDINTVVSEFPLSGPALDVTEPSSERVLLRADQPYANHNGGDLHIGPDGMLYIGLGDGGSGGDPHGHGQNLETLLGTILRIDPKADGDAAYSIPADNPFVADDAAQDEIWTWGLRNPWRFSFDSATGDLWIADVGQGSVEEINHLAAGADPAGRGANLGWSLREGDRSFEGDPPPDHVEPVHVYTHDDGRCSITGGRLSRGSLIPELEGVYLYADYCTEAVTGLRHSVDGTVRVADLTLDRDVANVIGFGEGPDGEIYIMEQGGLVSRLQPTNLALETTTADG